MKDLVKELNEFNTYVRRGIGPFGHDYVKGNYFYAFNPSYETHKELYQQNIRLTGTIYRVLDENCVNIKCMGYTFIKDAVCIITDMQSLDICLMKEVYPYIADKYGGQNVSKVEHSIRNALKSAYKTVKSTCPDRECIMNSFEKKPSNKKFLLRVVQEVSERLLKELCE